MEANASLLQYYVHKMMRSKNAHSCDDSPSPKLPLKLRNKPTRSYLVHEYNFLRKITSQVPTQRKESSPTQQARQLTRKFDGLNLSVKKYKHYKRSLQEEEQHKNMMKKMDELKKIRLSQLVFPDPTHLTVSAIRMETPVRDNDKFMRFTLENLKETQEQRPGKKKLRTLLGLETKRVELQNSQLKISQQLQPKQQLQPLPKTPVISQEISKSKKKGFDLKTITSLKDESLDTIFQERARNYRQFLFIVYLGCAAFMDIEPCSQKYQRRKDIKYQYYVGKGNNCNLIKSIMKKRWWWILSTQITQETRFVWTQRKVPSFIERQLIFDQYEYTESPTPDNDFDIPQQTQLLQLLHPKDMQIYKSYFKKIRKQPHSFKSRIKLIGKSNIRYILEEQFVHNHLQGNNNIGNKKALLKNMLNWYKFIKRSPDNYSIPQTFHVATEQDKEFPSFISYFKEKQKLGKQNNVWIIKPGQNSNRGHGIKVSRSLKTILGMLQNKNHTYVIQEYMTDLFLFNKRKFDIRTYILVTSLAGVLKAYWYQQGYIRTSSELYNLDDLSNAMIHLTNDAIQKYGENYGRYEPGNKISYAQFQKHLDANYSTKGFTLSKLVANMKSIATEAIIACYLRLDPNFRYSNFEIFGLDFIIDSNFKPKLLEVNTNPCLELSSPLLARIIPRMVENAFKIGLDPLYPPTACPYTSKPFLTDSVLTKNRFELIFDSQYDRDLQYQKAFPTDDCKYEDDDELFDNEGQILNVED